jgi:hypothetical protein
MGKPKANGGPTRMTPATPVLDRLLDAVSRCLTPDAARALIELRADPETQGRINELAERCNEGTLSPEERSEYEAFVSFSTFLAILQAKARKLLTRKRTGS